MELFFPFCIVIQSIVYYNTFGYALSPNETSLYHEDFNRWKHLQAKLLKNRDFEKVDVSNLVTEILYNMDENKYGQKYKSGLKVLILYLLKYKCEPEVQSKSWNDTIHEQRRKLEEILLHHPGLKPLEQDYLNQVLAKIMRCDGGVCALGLYQETKGKVNAKKLYLDYIIEEKFCWSLEEIKDKNFFPERTGNC